MQLMARKWGGKILSFALRVLVSERVVCGDMVKWKCLPCGIVNPSAIVLNTVANYQIINVEQRVVDGYLVEYVGCDGNARSLVFHNHSGAHVAAEEHGVGSQMLFADGQLHLVGKQWGRVAQVVDQVVDKMLPHPLFGSECNIAPPKNVETDNFMSKGGRLSCIVFLFVTALQVWIICYRSIDSTPAKLFFFIYIHHKRRI